MEIKEVLHEQVLQDVFKWGIPINMHPIENFFGVVVEACQVGPIQAHTTYCSGSHQWATQLLCLSISRGVVPLPIGSVSRLTAASVFWGTKSKVGLTLHPMPPTCWKATPLPFAHLVPSLYLGPMARFA